MRRLVEAELLLELVDELRVEPLRAAIPAFVAAGSSGGRWLSSLWLVPLRRAVASTALPVICAIICSTGPPGADWTMTKLITMIPNRVGMISRSRRRM